MKNRLVPLIFQILFLLIGISPNLYGQPAGFGASLTNVTVSQIQWSGYTWNVRSVAGNPGSNNWASGTSNVWIDSEGNLHLKILKIGDKWSCSEISSVESFGYGEYTLQMRSRIDQLEKNIVFGFFIYKENGVAVTPQENEIDIEFSRWNNNSNPNSQYCFQYREANANLNLITPYKFETKLYGNYSTHKFTWTKGTIQFQSYHGNSANLPADNYLITPAKIFSDTRVPIEKDEKVLLNLYLYQGIILTNQKESEVIVKSFTFRKS